MRLIIVSGLSGAGKTVALHTLEDDGFYCIDNLPCNLLQALVESLSESQTGHYENVAVGIDARSPHASLNQLPDTLDRLRKQENFLVEVMFLRTETTELVRRFSETRRKHPLSLDGSPLLSAIEKERQLLDSIQMAADLVIDTTNSNLHQLRQKIRVQLLKNTSDKMAILFQSFGFKHGVPNNTDFVFDVRCLPNPHWDTSLRPLTGNDEPVQLFLEKHDSVEKMFEQIRDFMESWIPAFLAENRAYMTISVGCTGGHHRSVYLVNRLAQHFSDKMDNVTLRHREL